MSKTEIKEMINVLETIKTEDYKLFILLKNHIENICLLGNK